VEKQNPLLALTAVRQAAGKPLALRPVFLEDFENMPFKAYFRLRLSADKAGKRGDFKKDSCFL
jgi:hypothetical protein